MRKKLLFISATLFLIFYLQGQNIDRRDIEANNEFRYGVNAFNQGFYNNAILALEKSLAINPNETQTRYWLGRAYFQGGLNGAALAEWDTIINSNSATPSLVAFSDIVSSRSGIGREIYIPGEYSLFAEYENVRGENDFLMFNRPVVAKPKNDHTGDILISSYITNEIVDMSVNGDYLNSYNAGLEPFNHPFDFIKLDENRVIVSEQSGDKISISAINRMGLRTAEMGKTGINEGEFLGPQFMAQFNEDSFFVTDWGNKRVVLMDYEGNYLYSFGKRSNYFSGLQGPTGIVYHNGTVLVADSLAKTVYQFDPSGNYEGELIENSSFGSPEGLSMTEDGNLLITTATKIWEYNIEEDKLQLIYQTDEDSRFLYATYDENRNLLISDFNQNKILLLTERTNLYSGLHTKMVKINSVNYPQITVEIIVEDIIGNPVVGLEEKNFIFKENGNTLGSIPLVYSGESDSRINIATLVDTQFFSESESIRSVLDSLTSSLEQNDTETVTGAWKRPTIVASQKENLLPLYLSSNKDFTQGDRPLDQSIRLAASSLFVKFGRKALVYIGNGNEGVNSFNDYSLTEMAQYLINNNISFNIISIGERAISPSLLYLARETKGMIINSKNYEGVTPLINNIRDKKYNSYTFQYNSNLGLGIGRSFIPFEVEVIYHRRSGRDELGFFPTISSGAVN